MREPLEQLTERVDRSASRLRQRYNARQLHVLRVSMRRIRTFLKQSGGARAEQMRKAWGGFAAATSDARDWDVFHKAARAQLTPEEFRAFRRLNRKRLQASHRAVKTLVNSENWSRHLDEWRRYLERRADCAAAKDRRAPTLEAAVAKAGAALAVATLTDEDRAWHKFRIAVKETRYIAEAAPAASARVREVIATCKSLQATLGTWHDTVIQLQLLDEGEQNPVHARLRTLTRRRKVRSLSQTRTMLAAQSVFVPT